MVEWVEYHAAQGVTHVTFYDAGALTQVVAEFLEPYLVSGQVDVVPFREIPKYQVLEGGHVSGAPLWGYSEGVGRGW